MRREKPRLSLWLTGLRETLEQLPAFIRLAHQHWGARRSTCSGSFTSKQPNWTGARRVLAVRERRRYRGQLSARSREARGRTRCACSMRRERANPRQASAGSRARHRGLSAAAHGRSCTSPRMAGPCRAASPPSPCVAMRTSPSAMPRPHRFAISGTEQNIEASAKPF